MTVVLNMSLVALSAAIPVLLLCCFGSLSSQDIFTVNMIISMDTLSVMLTMLILWVSLMSVIYLADNYSEAFKLHMLTLNASLTMLMLSSFLLSDLLLFFISYEISLIPILFMIWGWGGNFKKSKAGAFLLLYTSVMSMPLLLGILITQKHLKCFTWSTTNTLSHFVSYSNLIIMLMTLAFLVKTPMYGLHMWLPKAHVEASTMGSMILAGSLLKMGVYGILRTPFIHSHLLVSSSFFVVAMMVSVGGMCISSLLMLMMYDGKIAIALSSVSHMNMLLSSLMVFSLESFNTSYLISLSHGFISPAMFLIFSLYYKSMKSRNMMMSRATASLSCLSLGLVSFFIFMANAGCPPSYNFWGEFTIFFNLISFNPVSMTLPLFITSMSVLSFSSFMFSRMTNGNPEFLKKWTIKPSNLYVLLFLAIPSVLAWKYPL